LAQAPSSEHPRAVLQRLPAGNLTSLGVSRRGELALVADDGEIVIGDLATRMLTAQIRRKNLSISRWESAHWDASGDAIVIVDPQGTTSIDRRGVETRSDQKLAFPAGYSIQNTWEIESAPTGEVAAMAGPFGGDARLLVWPKGKRGEPARVLTPPAGGVTSMRFTPGGETLGLTVLRRIQRGDDQDPEVASDLFVVRGDGSEALSKPRFSLS